MNRVIALLIISDLFLLTGFGLVDPIFAIFMTQNLTNGTLVTAGIAIMLFFLVKSLLQLPLAHYIDKHGNSEFFLVGGCLIIAAVPFLYSVATHINHIYLIQVLYGIGSALAYPTWLGLFSTNIDKKKENFEWAVYSTCEGVGTALSAFIGAQLAAIIGFRSVFIIVGILSLIGACILLFLGKQNKKMAYHYKYMVEKAHGMTAF